MALQRALSQVSAIFSPASTSNSKCVQPPRNAKKTPDNDFVSPSEERRCSFDLGSTISYSQWDALQENDSILAFAPNSLPVIEGSDSLKLTSKSEEAISEIQVITRTPSSQHSIAMFSALSDTLTEEQLSHSMLPMSDYTQPRQQRLVIPRLFILNSGVSFNHPSHT